MGSLPFWEGDGVAVLLVSNSATEVELVLLLIILEEKLSQFLTTQQFITRRDFHRRPQHAADRAIFFFRKLDRPFQFMLGCIRACQLILEVNVREDTRILFAAFGVNVQRK